tara:strand:+ start:105 stop:245 length:141 start_codon:yes stop_codon:yes gene_type:complete
MMMISSFIKPKRSADQKLSQSADQSELIAENIDERQNKSAELRTTK